MNRPMRRFIPCQSRRQAPKQEEVACQEPPSERREAAIGGARLTAAPQERPFEARDRGRPREAVFRIVRGIEAGWPKRRIAAVRFTRARSDRARAVRRTRINQEYDRMGISGKTCTAFSTRK